MEVNRYLHVATLMIEYIIKPLILLEETTLQEAMVILVLLLTDLRFGPGGKEFFLNFTCIIFVLLKLSHALM